MSDVHDHDIKKAVDQLKSEGRDHYLDREPDSAGSFKGRRPYSIWDEWWGFRPHRSKKPDKSKHDKSKKPDDCSKPDKSKKPDDCKSHKSKKPDDCKSHKSKKPDDCKSHKSKKPDDCKSHKSKKPDRCKKHDHCRHKRRDHSHKRTHHHKRGRDGFETITTWSDGNLEEIKYRKR
ncbi:spore coat protein CotG [Bacillus sp. z60-18]|uniref:spore coat protein CotG n=1 Tax=Bacillus TaxID=1386 RepID=UPI00098B0119|nr:hypothetical protein [Bacillus sonorensis]